MCTLQKKYKYSPSLWGQTILMYSYPTGRTFFEHMNRASFLLQYQELKKTIEKTRFFWSKKLWQSCRKLQAPPFSQRSLTKGEGESKGICGSVGIGRGSKGSTPIPEKRGQMSMPKGGKGICRPQWLERKISPTPMLVASTFCSPHSSDLSRYHAVHYN